jgi:uncharacterized damage-inducible protein DinB
MAMKDAFLAEFDHEMATTRKLLERLPEAQFGWKPHQKSMSAGELATHLSNIPHWSEAILKQTSFDLAAAPPSLPPFTSRADLLGRFEQTTRAARASMDLTDGEWMVMWSLVNGGHEMFAAPRAMAFRAFVMNHSVHHRGQLSVYLRMLDVPVPAMYGPSADER